MTNALNTQLLTSVTPASIRQGDHNAFLRLYNDLHLKVFRFLLKKTSNSEDAKDLTQQCFIRLWQFRHTLSELHSIDKQVFVIAHSLLINHFEKEASLQKLRHRQLSGNCSASGSTGPASSFELSDTVSNAIGQLPPVRRKILIMKVFHDYSNKEIARRLEISVKTVEDHVTRAFRRMKEVMIAGCLVLTGFFLL